MTLDFVKKFLTPDLLTSTVKNVTMCGDVGDPIYCRAMIDICQYIKATNEKIRLLIITNGSYKSAEWWAKLGNTLNKYDQVQFSIDGYDQESNIMYRVNSNFNSIIKGLTTLRETNAELFISWAAIAFSFNESHLEQMKAHAASLGCDKFLLTKSSKFNQKYSNDKGIDLLEPSEEMKSKSQRYDETTYHLTSRRQDDAGWHDFMQEQFNQTVEEYKDSNLLPLCQTSYKGIFINANGNIYPCVWLAFPYNSLTYGPRTIHYKDSFFGQTQFNLNTSSFDEILADPKWDKYFESMKNKDKHWIECSNKCNTKEAKRFFENMIALNRTQNL